jgi:hypothetical protein
MFVTMKADARIQFAGWSPPPGLYTQHRIGFNRRSGRGLKPALCNRSGKASAMSVGGSQRDMAIGRDNAKRLFRLS